VKVPVGTRRHGSYRRTPRNKGFAAVGITDHPGIAGCPPCRAVQTPTFKSARKSTNPATPPFPTAVHRIPVSTHVADLEACHSRA